LRRTSAWKVNASRSKSKERSKPNNANGYTHPSDENGGYDNRSKDRHESRIDEADRGDGGEEAGEGTALLIEEREEKRDRIARLALNGRSPSFLQTSSSLVGGKNADHFSPKTNVLARRVCFHLTEALPFSMIDIPFKCGSSLFRRYLPPIQWKKTFHF
jgi:hypothetical protein